MFVVFNFVQLECRVYSMSQ